ncbi:Peptidoglycan synthase FtsI [Granulosicoccus antarcticus IMCC3135]|uniref:Peptidoglycan D,D-transpeptidase FtsI n=2 Tax=Granulosicoccus TaxID=437504 RepID=A0A2Z2NXB7_9GAMM|nr:Peptidoglycan synthase FtsI [Granulosicoccus antarcticus IMCC3135]
MEKAQTSDWSRRRGLVLGGFACLAIALISRAVYVQVIHEDFYLNQGQQRQIRTVEIPASRGDLVDRNGDPLAISAPIPSLFGNPKDMATQPERIREVAELLGVDAAKLVKRIATDADRGRVFTYLKRQVDPEVVDKVLALDVKGVEVMSEYRRYYPSAGAASHVIGFTGIDENGREGLEMAYDNWLSGETGQRRIIKDRNGREIAGMDVIKPSVAGKDLRLSIDRQLQYFANRALQEAVSKNDAESGSVVIMDVKTGEIMAMANYPTYNPNDLADRVGGRQRNRSLTDVFEPGSTMKPFTIAAALDSGKFKPDDIINTSPGRYQIGKYVISDDGKDNGWLDLTGIVTKSSNVGISRVARQLEPEQMWSVLDSFGFGRSPGSEFPGEVAGYFNHPSLWHHIEQASISFGYGISVTALQLVRAYATLANGGVMQPVSFLAQTEVPQGQRVIDETIANDVVRMLEAVVEDGSGKQAHIPGYRVAGKTGTSHKSQEGGYAEDRYVSVFAGFAPVSDPRFAAVVVVHDPKAGTHFGGTVAAPVFADVMSHGMRLGGIEPDDLDGQREQVSVQVIQQGERS